MQINPHTIELTTGYTDNDGVNHNSITFGHILTGEALFAIDNDPQSDLYTQKELLGIRHAITAFGSLPIPVPLVVLLGLDEFDLADLMKGYDDFSERIARGRSAEFISDSEVMLINGFESNSILYPKVKFGQHITGRDMVHADVLGYQKLKRTCFFIGRQIESISTADGSAEIKGPVNIDLFHNLFSTDLVALQVASEGWRSSFRRERGRVRREGVGAQRVDRREGDGVD